MRDDLPPYKSTFFDRHGADAGGYLHAIGYGAMVFGMSVIVGFILITGGAVHGSIATFLAVIAVAAFLGAGVAATSILLARAAGGTYAHLMMNGTSTPYKEQYSYQQTLVMQGCLDEALESFEAVILEKPAAVDARIKTAELYAREKGDAVRAAELFRDAQRIPSIDVGEDVYIANRLIDLYNGPLADPGRALVELRRLIDKYPRSAAADHARDALAALKPLHLNGSDA